jgi:hypothetical protein
VGFENCGGKLQPLPKKDFVSSIVYPPIVTVGHPTAAIAPQMHVSDVRIAGLPPIITVVLPMINGVAVT